MNCVGVTDGLECRETTPTGLAGYRVGSQSASNRAGCRLAFVRVQEWVPLFLEIFVTSRRFLPFIALKRRNSNVLVKDVSNENYWQFGDKQYYLVLG